LFIIISQVIGCEDHLRNDLDSVNRGVKLYSNSNSSNTALPAAVAAVYSISL